MPSPPPATSTTRAGRSRRAVNDGDVRGWGGNANAPDDDDDGDDNDDDDNDGDDDDITIEGMAATETNLATSANVAAVIIIN